MDPWPSFRAAVPTAERVLVGEVFTDFDPSASTGYLAAFKLRVMQVYRGGLPADGVLEVIGLKSGMPTTVCANSELVLLRGDVVALAINALGPDGRTRINTVAYVRKAGESVLTDVEDITPAQIAAMIEPADAERDAFSDLPWLQVGAGFLAVATLLVLLGALLRVRTRPG